MAISAAMLGLLVNGGAGNRYGHFRPPEVYYSLHTGTTPRSTNELTTSAAPGYARAVMKVTGGNDASWKATKFGSRLFMVADKAVQFPAATGAWSGIRSVGITGGWGGSGLTIGQAPHGGVPLEETASVASGSRYTIGADSLGIEVTPSSWIRQAGWQWLFGDDVGWFGSMFSGDARGPTYPTSRLEMSLHTGVPTEDNEIGDSGGYRRAQMLTSLTSGIVFGAAGSPGVRRAWSVRTGTATNHFGVVSDRSGWSVPTHWATWAYTPGTVKTNFRMLFAGALGSVPAIPAVNSHYRLKAGSALYNQIWPATS